MALFTASCQPKDVRPGAWLRGDSAEGAINDWTYTNDIEEIFIQTKTWYGIPHSTTIWCVAVDGDLYVGSYGEEKKRWEGNIAGDSDARLKIAGLLYKVSLSSVKDAALSAKLVTAYNSKYDMADVFGDDLPKWWYYRVTMQN